MSYVRYAKDWWWVFIIVSYVWNNLNKNLVKNFKMEVFLKGLEIVKF